MLQSVIFFDGVEKAVMHSTYLLKISILENKPQIHADNLSVFICGFVFADLDFCSTYSTNNILLIYFGNPLIHLVPKK